MTVSVKPEPLQELEHRKEACRTFVEQTKLLVVLASGFLFAPAAVQIVLRLRLTPTIIVAEALFVASVLSGYVALGAITGSQHAGQFYVHRRSARVAGIIQFASYFVGLCLFLYWFAAQADSAGVCADQAVGSPSSVQPQQQR